MPGTEKPKSGRRADRLQHELLVAYRTVDGFITDWATNLSRGGRGRVARVHEFDNPTNQVPGMGIEFIDVTDELKDRIERFVDQLRRELPESGRASTPSSAPKA